MTESGSLTIKVVKLSVGPARPVYRGFIIQGLKIFFLNGSKINVRALLQLSYFYSDFGILQIFY